MPSPEMLIELFRQSGRKITPQRRAILELLAQDTIHPTAEEIYQRVVATMPEISRATVYNTLHELVALGGLTEAFECSEGNIRYDVTPGVHHHLFCARCHTLVDIHHAFTEVTLPSEAAAGYQVLRHQITFYGFCPACQDHEKNQVSPADR